MKFQVCEIRNEMCGMKTGTKEDLKEVNNTATKKSLQMYQKGAINEIGKIG